MEVLNIDEMTDYGPERRVRKRLFMKERIEAELVCYEPGQNTVEHHHVGQDEIFIIMDGAGTIMVDGESRPVTKGDMIFAPAYLPHSVVVDKGQRMTMVFVKAPGRATKAKKRD